ncbi:hypothetical protein FACS18945_4960 [Bacteroidia bacterium]|nr:hypothetical protein FACS18945_4960 [Bacteroidia bacterium]
MSEGISIFNIVSSLATCAAAGAAILVPFLTFRNERKKWQEERQIRINEALYPHRLKLYTELLENVSRFYVACANLVSAKNIILWAKENKRTYKQELNMRKEKMNSSYSKIREIHQGINILFPNVQELKELVEDIDKAVWKCYNAIHYKEQDVDNDRYDKKYGEGYCWLGEIISNAVIQKTFANYLKI